MGCYIWPLLYAERSVRGCENGYIHVACFSANRTPYSNRLSLSLHLSHFVTIARAMDFCHNCDNEHLRLYSWQKLGRIQSNSDWIFDLFDVCCHGLNWTVLYHEAFLIMNWWLLCAKTTCHLCAIPFTSFFLLACMTFIYVNNTSYIMRCSHDGYRSSRSVVLEIQQIWYDAGHLYLWNMNAGSIILIKKFKKTD